MPLNPYKYNDHYFRNAEDQKSYINASDIDIQFNKLIIYLNESFIPQLNTLFDNSIPGTAIIGSQNKFFINVGDGTTTAWSAITKDLIDEAGLEINRLLNAAPNSILVTDANQIWQSIAPTEVGQLLIRTDNGLGWSKLTTEFIADRNIETKHIIPESITEENLADRIIDFIFVPQGITSDNFKDFYVTEDKIGLVIASNTEIDARASVWWGINNTTLQFVTNYIPANTFDQEAFFKRFIQNTKIYDYMARFWNNVNITGDASTGLTPFYTVIKKNNQNIISYPKFPERCIKDGTFTNGIFGHSLYYGDFPILLSQHFQTDGITDFWQFAPQLYDNKDQNVLALEDESIDMQHLPQQYQQVLANL